MEKVETIVFSVIFPGNLKYFSTFLKSLENQTNSNFKLLLVNDGVENITNYLQKTSLHYEIHSVQHKTPFEIRIVGLKIISKLAPSYIIFADTDDTFSPNRVEVLVQYLKTYTFVCNDIDLMNDQGNIFKKSFWSSRLQDNFEFDIHFIKNKNIIGLGNAGMQNKALKKILKKIAQIKEGNDWLFFSAAEENLHCIFLKQCSTQYRQHDGNLIGKKKINFDSFIYLIEGKIKHYTFLQKIGFKSYYLSDEINLNRKLLQLTLKEPEKIRHIIKQINSLETNFFWWEESNYIHQLNENNSI